MYQTNDQWLFPSVGRRCRSRGGWLRLGLLEPILWLALVGSHLAAASPIRVESSSSLVLIWSWESDSSNAKAGSAIASAGDVNGDGYDDLVLGMSGYSANVSGGGRVSLFFGGVGSRGFGSNPVWSYSSGQANAALGAAVASAGDVNGDGYADVLVGSPGFATDSSQSEEGRALLLYGSANGLSSSNSWAVESNVARAELGIAVAGLGDINTDGYADFAVGLPEWESSSEHTNEGAVWIFCGGIDGPAAVPDVTLAGGQSSAYFGYRIAGDLDLDADGRPDLVVSAHRYDDPESDAGAVFVFWGSEDGRFSPDATPISMGQAEAYFGSALAPAGDVNADGYDDLLVGAYAYDTAGVDAGAAFLFAGGAAGVATEPTWSYLATTAQGFYAQSVGSAGDISGDGMDDLLIGTPRYDGPESNEGQVMVFEGGTILSVEPAWIYEMNSANAQVGSDVKAVGDFLGDGCGGIAIGASGFGSGESSEGKVMVYSSTAGDHDHDGYCRGILTFSDCNDSDPLIYPGAEEATASGVDENCDDLEACYVDSDQDGYRDLTETLVLASDLSCLSPGLAPAAAAYDCDDSSPTSYPGATEGCNGIDDDCDSAIDEVTSIYYLDFDLDGYGDSSASVEDCEPPPGYVSDASDCNDSNAQIYPGASELIDNGLDDDCDQLEQCYQDRDNDGYRPEATATTVSSDLDCEDQGEANASQPTGDCDDAESRRCPGNLERCDNLDENCDGLIDNGVEQNCGSGDFDQDGFTELKGDCDDARADLAPNITERCDRLDNNCNGTIDEASECEPTSGGCACHYEVPARDEWGSGIILAFSLCLSLLRRCLANAIDGGPLKFPFCKRVKRGNCK